MTSPSNESKAILSSIAAQAISSVITGNENELMLKAQAIATEMGASRAPTSDEVAAVATNMVTQDPMIYSKRIAAVALAVASAVLSVPEVSAILGPWAPVATALVSALFAWWSKQADLRPIAGA